MKPKRIVATRPDGEISYIRYEFEKGTDVTPWKDAAKSFQDTYDFKVVETENVIQVWYISKTAQL